MEFSRIPHLQKSLHFYKRLIMSKRLEEILSEFEKENEYHFHDLDKRDIIFPAMLKYAREVAQASLEKASELPQNLYDDEWHLEKLKESVTNPDNVVLP